jgi:hypothetical protein
MWPTIDQAPPKKGWDKKGIDLLVFVEGARFPCAAQCKGFVVQDIGPDQTRQTCNSIEHFRLSGTLVDTYLVIHNREGKDPDFRREVNLELQELIASGQAKSAYLWDRQEFLTRCRVRLEERIIEGLHGRAAELLSYYSTLFFMGSTFVKEVPVSESLLRFRRLEPCKRIPVANCQRSVSKLILSPTQARWTLLTGTFGAGKTTTVLQAAASKECAPVLIECRLLPSHSDLLQGTSVLLEESLKTLRIFNDFSEADARVFYELAGTSFKSLLKRHDTEFVLILDGLDENRFYSHYRGMEFLSNQLAELRCPIVMTTRLEHLNSMFGDFSAAFAEFSIKYAPKRDARLLQLEPWTLDQAIALCELVLCNLSDTQRTRLQEFRDLLLQDSFAGLYGDLPSNPLMLRFIVDDVVDMGVRQVSRPILLDSWMRRKIRRDRISPNRSSIDDDLDLEEYVSRAITTMERVASRMVVITDGKAELIESIPDNTVKEVASSIFGRSVDNLLSLSLTSFLLPSGPSTGTDRSLVFAFRIVQEFLLARHLRGLDANPLDYPTTVQSLYREIGS